MEEAKKHPICGHFFENLMILIFEAIGTAMVTMLFISSNGHYGMFIGYFVLMIFGYRITGAHYNPVITLAFMLRKDPGHFNIWLGILYMLFQLAGAYAGTCFIFYCFADMEVYLTLTYPYYIIQFMVSETLGSFIFVTAYLSQTEKKYKISEDDAITLLVISASYVIGMALSHPRKGEWF